MASRVSIARSMVVIIVLLGSLIYSVAPVRSQFGGATPIVPSVNPLFFGSSGDVNIDIPKPGIAVRVEVPREFLQGIVSAENDTHFIQSNIRNDYFYYSVVDESGHWSYAWRGKPSEGPCFKPTFPLRDPNAPWCVEIWNYLNNPSFRQPIPNFDYCANKNTTRWVFTCFSPPKFIRFTNLNAPQFAGMHNFTLFVANRTNSLGLPDFVRAWNTTLFVPVSMSNNPASLRGWICDGNVTGCPNIRGKGVVYAKNTVTGQVARAYVNQSLCTPPSYANCGFFTVTGLAPGSYVIQASAGVSNGVAYSLTTSPVQAIVGYGGGASVGGIRLRRAPLVCGIITYENSFSPGANIHSLSDHPYLRAALGLKPPFQLNVTVEATDPWGHVYRFLGVSSNTTSGDQFTLNTGTGVKYVGADPYGSEFAGLPGPEYQGPYQLTIQVWVSGYLQRYSEFAIINQSPGGSLTTCTSSPNPNPVVMWTGGVITGTIQLWNLQTLETPNQANASLGVPIADPLFGGNILIQVYNSSGIMSGFTLYDGTLRNGLTSYANSSSIPFYVFGFTEYYNHSWSGVWGKTDYGLAPDPIGYTIRVFIRGYEQAATDPIPLALGSSSSVTIRMIRGGAFSVTVGSYDNRFGTRAIQAQMQWEFLNLAIPVTARVYFYGSGGLTIGFVGRLMTTSQVNQGGNSFTVTFAGQNWSIREIVFYGNVPTHISSDTYTIRAYTLGYVPLFTNWVTAPNDLVGFGQVFVALLIGNEVSVTVPIFAGPQIFTTTPEYDHAIGQVFSGPLSGAVMANVSAGTPTLQFPIYGFGGMILNSSTLVGQGHFFYVAPEGTRYFDYGLDVGNYTAQLPEFGFNVHFLQVLQPPVVQFRDLFLELGVFLKVYAMARVIQNSLVVGWNFNAPLTFSSLSWAQVQASNQTYSRSVSTFDGRYEGVGALQLPAGTYNITYSDLFFQSKTKANFPIQWNGVYSLSPSEPLCPVGGIAGTCTATEPIYFSLASPNLLVAESRNCIGAFSGSGKLSWLMSEEMLRFSGGDLMGR